MKKFSRGVARLNLAAFIAAARVLRACAPLAEWCEQAAAETRSALTAAED